MPIWGNCSFPELWSSVLLVAASGCWSIWFLLCGTEFQQHYIWKILGDDCPTEDTGPCGLASCILMFQACILHQVWLRCPGRVVIPQVLVLLMWTEYCCPLSWCGSGTLPCGPSSRWQRCHQQILFHSKGGFGDDCNALISKFSMKRFATIGLMGEPMAAPSTCS